MKPDIKSVYEVPFLGDKDKVAYVHFDYYKEVVSSDYDSPGDPECVEIDKIEIGDVDMTFVLFEIAEEWVMSVEEEIIEHCNQ